LIFEIVLVHEEAWTHSWTLLQLSSRSCWSTTHTNTIGLHSTLHGEGNGVEG